MFEEMDSIPHLVDKSEIYRIVWMPSDNSLRFPDNLKYYLHAVKLSKVDYMNQEQAEVIYEISSKWRGWYRILSKLWKSTYRMAKSWRNWNLYTGLPANWKLSTVVLKP